MTNRILRNELVLILVLFFSINLAAQGYVTEKTAPEKAVESYKEGRQLLYADKCREAIGCFEKALKKAPTFIDAQLLWAESHAVLKEFPKAIEGYNKVIAMDPNYKPKVYYALANIAFEQKEYAECAKQMEVFLSFKIESPELKAKAERMLGNAKFIPNALANPVPFKPENLGPNINSEGHDYAAVLTADGNTMVFTRLLVDGRSRQEDFYVSQKDDKGNWMPAQPFGDPVNTPNNEGAESIAANGKLLVYTTGFYPDNIGQTDLYFSEYKDGKWTQPKNMGAPINTRSAETQPALSANGDLLIFASNRVGSIGDLDLWSTRRKPDGTWTEPENITELNTISEDGSPFLHADGQTLYFRSRGLVGMGGFDLYISRMQPNGKWGKPENLGYPINTPGEEGLLVISLDGKKGYFFSDKGPGGIGMWDIYQFDIPESIRPKPATYARATVLDADTKQPLRADAVFIDLASGQTFAKSLTDKDGKFLVCLPAGNRLALEVSRKGYAFHSENFDLVDNFSADKPYELTIYLQKLPDPQAPPQPEKPAGKPVVLKNVFFESGSAALKNESRAELDRLKAMLDENPNINIQLRGHTDNVGSDADNLALSQARADAVMNYLSQHGVAPGRLSAKGFGETQPIDTNDTASGRANNRRTEFQVM